MITNDYEISFDKLEDVTRAGANEVKCTCPQCSHHTLSVNKLNGTYHCWSCGMSGRMQGYEGGARKVEHEGWRTKGGTTKAGHEGWGTKAAHEGWGTKAGHEGGARKAAHEGWGTKAAHEDTDIPTVIEDYTPLKQEILDQIEEVSDEANVTGAQLEVRKYLAEQGISINIARLMNLGVTTRRFSSKGKDKEGEEPQSQELPCIVYRNYVDGYCCNAKYRSVGYTVTRTNTKQGPVEVRKPRKDFTQDSSFTPCAPYGIDCLAPVEGEEDTPLDQPLIITEGEKDCVILRMLGYHYVISAANGAQTKHEESFEAFRPWLSRVDRVVICGDQDKPGRRMVRALIDYFDDKRLWSCTWDQRRLGKDISEVYQRCGIEVVVELIRHSDPISRKDLVEYKTEEERQQVALFASGQYDHGYSLGIGSLVDRRFKLFDQGGLIILTGTPGTGKTDFLNFLTTRLMMVRNASVCYCSFETPNKLRHAGEITNIIIGEEHPESLPLEVIKPYAEMAMAHVTHIVLDNESPSPESILRKAEVCLRRHPDMQYLVIDPYLYMQLSRSNSRSETEAIRDMLTYIRSWALLHKIWVFIVAHPRKLNKEDGSSEWEKIDYYTISGSANWANIADYVLSVHRVLREAEHIDYTEVGVLKVRDQKVCRPGDLFFIRHASGRYFVCDNETEAQKRHAQLDTQAYEIRSLRCTK